jgi:hypothetical protein
VISIAITGKKADETMVALARWIGVNERKDLPRVVSLATVKASFRTPAFDRFGQSSTRRRSNSSAKLTAQTIYFEV